jgi:hypothetical protein
MKKLRLIEVMEKVNPDMKISHEDMHDLMMRDTKYVKKYYDRINELNADEIYDILRYNPESYNLLKDYAKKIFTGDQLAHIKAYVPELSENFTDLNYKINPMDIEDIIKIDLNKITKFSDLFNNDDWLQNNYKGIKTLLEKYPKLENHSIFDRAKVLDRKGIIDL